MEYPIANFVYFLILEKYCEKAIDKAGRSVYNKSK